MTNPDDKPNARWSDFEALDVRVGTITRVEAFPEARKPAWKLWLDFGPELGEMKSSAQITTHYEAAALLQKQVLAVVNFETKQIGNFQSECLVLGVYNSSGVVLITPDKPCKNGDKLG